jgi:hypothetical protein
MKTPAEEIGLQRIRSLRIRHSGKNQADLLIRFG